MENKHILWKSIIHSSLFKYLGIILGIIPFILLWSINSDNRYNHARIHGIGLLAILGIYCLMYFLLFYFSSYKTMILILAVLLYLVILFIQNNIKKNNIR
jgi:CHASE2 domain-containing sensor protein